VEELDVYSLVGESGLTRLVAAFYRRVPQDDILGPMYPAHDLAGSEQRLRDFLIYRLGGPPRYIEQRGHPRLRVRHAPFHINSAARERWMQLMTAALEEAAFPPEADQFLRTFLGEIASFLVNRAGPGA
jgi:hemoglobin